MKSKTMKLLALALTVIMVFMLAGCEVSTSSTSTTTVSTSKTDENGNTTTTTTTTEVGGSVGTDGVNTTNQTTTTTTTTSADEAEEAEEESAGFDPDALREHLVSLYNTGAEGTNEDGDTFYFLCNMEEGHNEALLVIVSADREHYNGWEGEALKEDDHVLLSGAEHDVPFSMEETDDGFIMTFRNDGNVATMTYDDVDNVIDDVVAARMEFAG